MPSKLSAAQCVVIFLPAQFSRWAAIVIPAIDWVALVPERIDHVTATLQPVLDLYANLERFVDNIASRVAELRFCRASSADRNAQFDARNHHASAPHALIQLFFALLVIYFFLAGWTGIARSTIRNRGSFEGAMTTARVIQDVVEATSTYIGTNTVINVTLGAVTALCFGFWNGFPRSCGAASSRSLTTSPISARSSRQECSLSGA